MRDQLCALGEYEAGEIETRSFPDGETYQRLMVEPTRRDVILIGGTTSDSTSLELYDLACSVVKNGARRLTMLMPYFGYSTMERAVRTGEVVKAKTRARLFSSVPTAAEGTRILLLDLHSEGISHYFEGNITTHHIYGKPFVARAARRLAGDDFVLACTDAGRAKWVESLANDLGVAASFVFKRRLSGDRTVVTAVSAQVEGRNVVIYDDMIRTGGSLLQAAKAYAEAGAKSLTAITTHGLFPGDALARLQDSGVLSRIVCTDSHPRARELASDFLQVESVVELFLKHLTD
jgi:ribose-phosphate pyrophosphokinase